MSNKNYLRGVKIERTCMEELKAEGYNVSRTSGSHGVYDVVAVKCGQVRFIQLKRLKKDVKTYKTPEDLVKFAEFLGYAGPNNDWTISCELWIWLDRHSWREKRLI